MFIIFNKQVCYGDYEDFSQLAVPTPLVSINAPSTQTVGQSLTLGCSMTAVRGITSRVDIIWRSYGTVLRRVNSTLPTINNSLVYSDTFTMRFCLCSADQNEQYQCEVVINASLSVMTTGSVNITLDVIGKIQQLHTHTPCFFCPISDYEAY